MTQHAITIRPICFSTKTFKKLDKNMQARSSRPARKRRLRPASSSRARTSRSWSRWRRRQAEARAVRRPRADEEARRPVMAEYAKEIGAEQIFAKINAIK
jgi:TRAP-type C4-dicarboxylate transport system substrate-binding protein